MSWGGVETFTVPNWQLSCAAAPTTYVRSASLLWLRPPPATAQNEGVTLLSLQLFGAFVPIYSENSARKSQGTRGPTNRLQPARLTPATVTYTSRRPCFVAPLPGG